MIKSNTKRVFPLNDQNIADLINPDLGATVIKPSALPIIPMLHGVTALSFSFTEVKKTSSLVSNYSFKCLSAHGASVWTVTSNCIAHDLNGQLRDRGLLNEEIRFDDLYLTSYHRSTKKSALGVGPHRDTNCKGLVVAVVLTGTLPFFVCREKDLSGLVSIPVSTGEILLLRGEGFQSLPKPLHYVGDPGERAVIQFGLRQYINPNFKKD